jgi:uncharacterized protein (DUF1684 family)
LRSEGVAFSISWIIAAAMICGACSKPKSPRFTTLSASDSLAIVDDNIRHRAEMDTFFSTEPDSPFKKDSTIQYHGIRWFPIQTSFRVTSTLHRYDHPDTVVVLGTKGEERHELKYGYFEFVLPDDHGAPSFFQLNVYKFTPYDGKRYQLYKDNLSVWFRDRTTGKETYDVGRYVDVGTEHPDEHHVYEIDFNKSYNPYCAYSSNYSCAVPRKEDFLDLPLRAGEMKYHE